MYLIDEVEYITDVNYEESIWLRIWGQRGREVLFLGCVYMPTESSSVSVLNTCYELLKEDVLNFKEKGGLCLWGTSMLE